MGERVVIDPGAPPRPAEPPRPAVPLGYGRPAGWVPTFRRTFAPLRDGADAVARRLGGWRRIGFAFGWCFATGGLVYAWADRYHDEAAVYAALGALLIGLTVPVTGLDRRGADGPGAR